MGRERYGDLLEEELEVFIVLCKELSDLKVVTEVHQCCEGELRSWLLRVSSTPRCAVLFLRCCQRKKKTQILVDVQVYPP